MCCTKPQVRLQDESQDCALLGHVSRETVSVHLGIGQEMCLEVGAKTRSVVAGRELGKPAPPMAPNVSRETRRRRRAVEGTMMPMSWRLSSSDSALTESTDVFVEVLLVNLGCHPPSDQFPGIYRNIVGLFQPMRLIFTQHPVR